MQLFKITFYKEVYLRYPVKKGPVNSKLQMMTPFKCIKVLFQVITLLTSLNMWLWKEIYPQLTDSTVSMSKGSMDCGSAL